MNDRRALTPGVNSLTSHASRNARRNPNGPDTTANTKVFFTVTIKSGSFAISLL